MSGFFALIRRDLTLAARVGGDVLTVVLFFALIGIVLPFAIGPDRPLLTRLAPAIIMTAILLALLLAIDRLFRADHEDGTLAAMRFGHLPLEAVVFAKMIAQWLTTALPLLLATPLMGFMLNLPPALLGRTLIVLLLGTPALIAFGAIGAAVTVTLRRGGLLAPILVLPLCLPTLIFAVGALDDTAPGSADAAFWFLAGIALLATAFTPFIAAYTLRLGSE